jgi:hypothetical protein
MATKPKRIEDMSEAELSRLSGKAYDRIMPSPEPGEQVPSKNFKPAFEKIKAEAAGRSEAAQERASRTDEMGNTYKKGGAVRSASKRGDGIAQRGKTRGTLVMCGGGKV